MGTKKAVFSESMGLKGMYDGNERRCERPAVEWSVDSKMQRKIRVTADSLQFSEILFLAEMSYLQIPDLEDRRNGIGMANPGDKVCHD